MARIIETIDGSRRTIRLTTDDVISVVKEYQRIVNKHSHINEVRDCLNDTVIYIPEDV